MSTTSRSAARWRKSSRSSGQGGACVEVAALTPTIAIRDSKDPSGPRLVLDADAAASLLTAIKAGAHDLL
ncbi:DUF397 domain-containing protein [Actinomadura darangshiensis]|uniref:DUF397 domain-containing protein n=1 Tax=Actinomadura darangshiensis TaxID=705336 RepID=A0A4R5AG60_9ACTN|nr:DUF397 domain-containing protein [Actinomadura darangshiensis]TDD70346.1 DUF397 domain-containing protein [Actinomadura darangshiensis]